MSRVSSHQPKLTEAEQAGRMLRIWEVLALTGFASRDSIYRLIKAGQFPPQRKLTPGGRASGWVAAEVQSYLNSLQAVQVRSGCSISNDRAGHVLTRQS
jgi:predicted DNA-binding transcriptional regulator AlpA